MNIKTKLEIIKAIIDEIEDASIYEEELDCDQLVNDIIYNISPMGEQYESIDFEKLEVWLSDVVFKDWPNYTDNDWWSQTDDDESIEFLKTIIN
jgi:hypothetical protein